MGTLRIKGTIDVHQFWPNGTSDADTVKLVVTDNSFEFKGTGSGSYFPTSVFKDASSKGQGTKPVVHVNKSDGVKSITIRVEHLDACELHYKAAPLPKSSSITDDMRKKYNSQNKERRQNFGESAAFALGDYLKQFANNKGLIDAFFETNVDYPSDVVDTYGRFIGNIIINNKNINLWLVENGWAFPTFYSSATEQEIQKFLDAWKKGKNIAKRIGKALTKDANKFDPILLYQKPSANIKFKIGQDAGLALMPKIFRRQTTWMVSKLAGIIPANTSFKAFLQKSPDELVLIKDFMEFGVHSAPTHYLHEYVDNKNQILKNPEDFVFKEKPSVLVDKNGKKIIHW